MHVCVCAPPSNKSSTEAYTCAVHVQSIVYVTLHTHINTHTCIRMYVDTYVNRYIHMQHGPSQPGKHWRETLLFRDLWGLMRALVCIYTHIHIHTYTHTYAACLRDRPSQPGKHWRETLLFQDLWGWMRALGGLLPWCRLS